MNEELLTAIRGTKTPPCEEFNCDRQEDCGERLLACKEFAIYVHSPHRKQEVDMPFRPSPTSKIYNKVFSEGDDE